MVLEEIQVLLYDASCVESKSGVPNLSSIVYLKIGKKNCVPHNKNKGLDETDQKTLRSTTKVFFLNPYSK
jgi:hypothetical protein